MDDRSVAATLTAAIIAKTDLPAGKDPVGVVVRTYQRVLKSVARAHGADAGQTKAPKSKN
ncbi:MAG: hypothetical protein ACREDP_22935 [Bradyrhizobium sp.]